MKVDVLMNVKKSSLKKKRSQSRQGSSRHSSQGKRSDPVVQETMATIMVEQMLEKGILDQKYLIRGLVNDKTLNVNSFEFVNEVRKKLKEILLKKSNKEFKNIFEIIKEFCIEHEIEWDDNNEWQAHKLMQLPIQLWNRIILTNIKEKESFWNNIHMQKIGSDFQQEPDRININQFSLQEIKEKKIFPCRVWIHRADCFPTPPNENNIIDVQGEQKILHLIVDRNGVYHNVKLRVEGLKTLELWFKDRDRVGNLNVCTTNWQKYIDERNKSKEQTNNTMEQKQRPQLNEQVFQRLLGQVQQQQQVIDLTLDRESNRSQSEQRLQQQPIMIRSEEQPPIIKYSQQQEVLNSVYQKESTSVFINEELKDVVMKVDEATNKATAKIL